MKHTYLSLLFLISFTLAGIGQSESRLSTEEKQYGLAQFWRGATMNFAFFDQVPELDWDSLFQAYIPKVQATETDYAYVRLLQEMCAQLKDGHTRVYFPPYIRKQRSKPAVFTGLIDGRVFITKVVNDTVAEMGIERGIEILAIDDVPVHKYADQNVRPYCFASTQQDLDVRVYTYHLLEGWKTEPVRLKLRTTDGEEIEKVLPRDLERQVPARPLMSLDIGDDGIGHLKITRFWGDDFESTFDSLFPLLAQTKSLIVDIRINDGGNSANAVYVLWHLSNKPFYTSNWSTPVYNAAFDSWGREQEWYGESGEFVEHDSTITPYQKPIILLIGPRTYSAGEDFCSYYQQAEIGPMMGEPTAGSTGNPTGVRLVNDIWSQVCTKRDVFYDGTEFVGYGVQPDIPVKASAADFWGDKDTVLEAARAYLRKQ